MSTLSLTSVLLLTFSLLSGFACADNLALKLDKINMQLNRAEIFAANCMVEVQSDKKIHPNCTTANSILQQMNKKLEQIAALNNNNISEINKSIMLLRAKIAQVNDNLMQAKIITGTDDWPASLSNTL